MGAVRLLELFAHSGEEPRGFAKLLTEYSETLRLPERILKSAPARFAATGGNIEALAKIAGAEPDARGVSRLGRTELDWLIRKLAALNVRDRAQAFNLKPDRADVILPAAVVYDRLASLAGAEQIVVPGVGIREGIILDLAVSAPVGGRVIEDRIRHDTLTLGRKFGFEESHALAVSALALSLFDQLAGLHGLGGRDRRLLQAASMLHDVGNFLSYKGHHKHSLYLISQSELPGFTPREMFVVANIGRYHRKGPPEVRHRGFALLPSADRDRVRKLAAILRVADAMDREHRGKITRIEVREAGRDIEIQAEARGDLLLEAWALKKKSRLFQSVFGKRLILRTGGET
jgi:exopolyphosphatase/guanosine-5'-triphosphate,3'-diphosphate pyrophosphatase